MRALAPLAVAALVLSLAACTDDDPNRDDTDSPNNVDTRTDAEQVNDAYATFRAAVLDDDFARFTEAAAPTFDSGLQPEHSDLQDRFNDLVFLVDAGVINLPPQVEPPVVGIEGVDLIVKAVNKRLGPDLDRDLDSDDMAFAQAKDAAIPSSEGEDSDGYHVSRFDCHDVLPYMRPTLEECAAVTAASGLDPVDLTVVFVRVDDLWKVTFMDGGA